MKVLNLIYPEQSDIKYKISKFPDGQQNIVIDSKTCFELAGAAKNWCDRPIITIKSRLNNFFDLEVIICAVASLRELGVEEIHLYTPYIMGARSDRKFEDGGNNYLKDVICPIINSLGFKTVICIDPHSDILEACIKGFKKQSNLELAKYATREICGVISEKGPNSSYPFVLVSPDAGASKKIYKLAEQIGYKGDIITCSKERDVHGELSKTVVPISTHYADSLKDHIIIDDICDGGATFINIAKSLKERYFNMNNEDMKGKIYLIVTHGIFSKGFKELHKYFNGIYCTNSYSIINPLWYMQPLHSFVKNDIKQLNVFR